MISQQLCGVNVLAFCKLPKPLRREQLSVNATS